MKSKKYEILLDIYRGVLNAQNIQFTTEDAGACVLKFKILEDKITPYSLENCIVRMLINGQQQDCTIEDEVKGTVSITLLQSMLLEGSNIAELQVYDSLNQTLRLTTPNFRYNVKKSLMNSGTVEADPNFSILQTMILEVSNANDVANAAKTTAESALSKANQAVTTINTEVAKVNKSVEDANAALDRAESVVTQEELANKIGYNGIFDDTNFNFIGSEIVQDGLIDKSELVTNNITLSFRLKTDDVFIGSIAYHKASVSEGWRLETDSKGSIIRIAWYNSLGDINYFNYREYTPYIGEYIYHIVQEDDYIIVFLNGEKIISGNMHGIVNPGERIIVSSKATDVYVYDRVLSPEELQQNQQYLSNSQSVNSIGVTGKDGVIKNYILGSDSEHVTMRTGYNVEEFATSVMEMSAKEFISTGGKPIKIDNGMAKSKLLNAEIKGQTLKSIIRNGNFENGSNWHGIGDPNINISNNTIKLSHKSENFPPKVRQLFYGSFQPFRFGGRYYVSCEVKYTSFTDTAVAISLYGNDSYINIGSSVTGNSSNAEFVRVSGIIEATNAGAGYNNCSFQIFNPNQNLEVGRACEIRNVIMIDVSGTSETKETMDNKITSAIPFGLSSTQAVITNNGMQYPIYYPTIDGKTKILKAPKGTQSWVEISADEVRDTVIYDYKLESVNSKLGSVSSIYDYIDLSQKTKIENTKEIRLDGSEEGWVIGGSGTPSYYYQLALPFSTKDSGVSNNYVFTSIGNTGTSQGVYVTGNSLLRIRFGKEKTLEDFKTDLKTNNLVVRVGITTPQTIQLTDEQLRAYDKYKKLILLPFAEDKVTLNENGSATWVNASSRGELTGVEAWSVSGTVGANSTVFLTTTYTDVKRGSNSLSVLISDKLPSRNGLGASDGEEGIFNTTTSSGRIYIRVLNTKATTVEQLRLYLKDNPIPFTCLTENPATTHIPKELVPTILTDKINTLSVGNGVNASSFKVTVPVDRVSELLDRMAALEAKTNTRAVNVPYVDETYANSVNKIEEVMANV